MTFNDGPRRKGRFLRRDSKVLEKVVLTDFKFGDLEASGNVMADNAVRNIIHAKYHEASELARNIEVPARFSEDLLTPQQRRSVIMPVDFTKDWERANRLSKGRRSRHEDEDFELESTLGTQTAEEEEEEAAQLAAQAASGASRASAQPSPAALAHAGHAIGHAGQSAALAAQAAGQAAAHAAGHVSQAAHLAHSQQSAPAAPAPQEPTPGPLEMDRFSSIDVVGKAIKGLGNASYPSPQAVDDFIPNAPVLAGEEDPEASTAVTYRQRVAEKQIDEEAVHKAFEEAKGRGFQEGYRQGEEKAEIAVRQNAELMFGKVVELLREFANLKREVLAGAQENFYTLCQAMAEALTRREFTIRPESFVAVLEKAIDEAVDTDAFKIRVHPDTFARIESVAPAELRASLVKDGELEPGDFRIESNLSVVDVNLRSMLKELLDQADLGLYDETEGKKAG